MAMTGLRTPFFPYTVQLFLLFSQVILCRFPKVIGERPPARCETRASLSLGSEQLQFFGIRDYTAVWKFQGHNKSRVDLEDDQKKKMKVPKRSGAPTWKEEQDLVKKHTPPQGRNLS